MISLDNLVRLHDSEDAIHRHKRILEELFYLCINDTFLETVTEARVTIQEMLPDIDLVFPCEREVALQIRNRLTDNPAYQSLLSLISDKHNYYHSSFTRNYRRIGTDVVTHNHFNILENIIFFNNPIPEENPLDYFSNRSGFMEIADDEIMGPVVRIQFDLGTTKGEMINIIEKDFPDTKELLEQNYNIPKIQYREDGSLAIKKFIYRWAYYEETDVSISIKLSKSGLLGSEVTGDHVKKYRHRMNTASARFQNEERED